MNKRGIAAALVAAFLLLCGCGGQTEIEEEASAAQQTTVIETGEPEDAYIYYLHTDSDCQSIWTQMGELFSRRSGIPVTVEYVAPEEYEIRLQQVMAGQKIPTAFFLPDQKTAYVWDDYTAELSGTMLGKKVRYPSEYLYFQGKAAGLPDRSSSDRSYVALNAGADRHSIDATEHFFSWIFCSAEGRMAFPNRGLADCYE